MIKQVVLVGAVALSLAACAGRDPNPTQVVQPQDANSDCAAIQAEITASSQKLVSLQKEESDKRTQNVVAGTVGAILFFPALLAMDFKNASGIDAAALQQRQIYLMSLQRSKHCEG